MALDKPLTEVEESDLRDLIDRKVSEQKILEYKQALPEARHESRREFLADVSSFANTAGGHILYGVAAEGGVPLDLLGITSQDVDGDILRLDNLLRDNLQPRIQGVSIRAVSLASGSSVLIVSVPNSWMKPHVVNFEGHWRFYARHSAGKYALDVAELKSAYLAGSTLGERIKQFRFERVSRAAADETPVSLAGKPRLLLHIVPYSAFSVGAALDLRILQENPQSLPLVDSYPSGYRYNLDGFLVFSKAADGRHQSYLQVFRNGIVESASAAVFRPMREGLLIPSIVFEAQVIETVKGVLKAYERLSIEPPLVLMASLLAVHGYSLAVSGWLESWPDPSRAIDRDQLLLPDVLLEDRASDIPTILRPIFDALWNSAGWPQSFGYDSAGQWGQGRNFVR